MDSDETLRILLIEDNPTDADYVKDLLEESERNYFSVDVAERLAEGVECCDERAYDAILLDLALPDSEGSETFETLSPHTQGVPIVILTGLEDRALALQLVRRGAQDYLVKGHFDYDRIERSIRYAIERIRAEQALKQRAEQLQRFMTMVDLANDSIIGRDLNNRITYWNKGAERLYGWGVAEAFGKMLHTFLHTEFPQSLQEVDDRLFATGGWTGELKHTTREGERIIVECHQTLQHDETGRPSAIFEINTDITERKQSEEKLKRYSERLEELVEERTAQLKDAERLAGIGETAAMIGHDLRNPLQALQFALELELKYLNEMQAEAHADPHASKAAQLFASMEQQIQYMDKIVGDLQDYARPIALELETVAVSTLITDVLASLPHTDHAKIITHMNDLQVTVDPHLMRRVFANLILNALQAMPKGGALTINASASDYAVAINVHDTGVGIPEEMKDKLFSPLITGKAKGTGLGLAVVKRIVDAHGGQVTFESKEGKGTTFTVTLLAESDEGAFKDLHRGQQDATTL